MATSRRKTLWCGNISDKVTEELLFELFIQAGPLEAVTIPKSREGTKRNFAFIRFKHEESVGYAKALMDGVVLCGKLLRLDNRSSSPVENDTYSNVMSMHQRSISCPERFSGSVLSNGTRNETWVENNAHGRDFRESSTPDWRNEDSQRNNGRRGNWGVESRNEHHGNPWNGQFWADTSFEQPYFPQNNFVPISMQNNLDAQQQLMLQQAGFQNMSNYNPFQHHNNPWGGYGYNG